MPAPSPLTDPRPSLLSLPLDIHALLLNHLSPSDISKLRILSHASYDLFTSPAICSHYLSRHGIVPESQDTAKGEFDRYFPPRTRIKKGTPTRATIVDGLRMTNLDAPYFTTSHAYQSSGDNLNRDGVVAYRTNAGDLALLDLSNPSNSSVLLITETWEFTTQPLAEYNKSGAGVAVFGGGRIKERISGGWWTAESFKDEGIGLKKFEVNVHSDFGAEVLFVELSWIKDEKATAPYDVITLLSAAHTPLPSENERTWYPIVAGTKSLGLVISLKSERFGHPIAAFSLPLNKFPYAEYVLNKYYIAGVVPTTQQFAFLRYVRDDMDTVCAINCAKKDYHGSQVFWKLQDYLPAVVLIDLAKMGLSELRTERGVMFANNMDIHIQPDRAGELVFIITGAGVTVFDIARISQHGGLSAVKTFWWRQKNAMRIYILPDEDLDKEEVKRVGSWREGMWARTEGRSNWGKKLIAPSVPRIWKSFIPGKVYGGGDGDDEMFTIVRAYNYVVRVGQGEIPFERTWSEVPVWQRPDFLVAWEIPLTRKGVGKYSSQMLNRRAGFQDSKEDTPEWGSEENRKFSCWENPEGIYPMEGDEYREIVGPVERGKWKPEREQPSLLKLARRQERVLLRVNRDTKLLCERPHPRTIRFGKRRSGFMSMFWGKGENLQAVAEKPTVKVSGLEVLPKGNIHHIKVGDSGNYIVYVINASPMPTGCSGGPSGTLVIVRYD
ncbi:uncharacterized protein DFL_008080 [Arthrobotrys flagrans]|uniref:F-box domain-containing protein n=1 Tax=Arthrobotrys flagrans TaxID=97331 RepID=A0A436ZMU2_ARTFL|nr:hypothetical protein DFL_008080 [Arthrobotrys flagrans]